MLTTCTLSLMLGRERFAVQFFSYFLFHTNSCVISNFILQDANILHIIHSLNNFHPLHCFDGDSISEYFVNHGLQFVFALEEMSLPDHLPEEGMHCVLECSLHKTEVLIYLIP